MSGLVFDIDDLKVEKYCSSRQKEYPIRNRVIAQFIDMEYGPFNSVSKYFCKIVVRNLPTLHSINHDNQQSGQGLGGGTGSSLLYLHMDERTFEQFFINDQTKVDFQPGDPIDIQALTWHEYDSEGMFIWESINLRRISMEEVAALREFILSPQGQYFLHP